MTARPRGADVGSGSTRPREDAPAGAAALRKGEQGTTLRYRMMALARTRENVISLGRGDPDLDTPAPIIESGLARFGVHGHAPGAAGTPGPGRAHEPVRGLLSLREGIARRYASERGATIDPDTEIIITNGAQEGLFLAMLALVDPGDRVACQDPRYSSYDQAIGVAGGEIVPIPTGGDRPFHLGPEDLREHAPGARVLVFVNPSNPTGSCVGPEGVRRLARAADELGLVVLADEIYEDVVFGKDPFLSFLAAGGRRERIVVLSGFSKAYAMTGFRVGYLIGPPAFIDAVEALKSTTSGPCPAFSQLTALAALGANPDPRQAYLDVYRRRRRALIDGFARMGIPHGPHGGGLFMWADVSRWRMDAETFCYRLLDEAGVLMFPGNSFGDRWRSWVRVSLLAPEARIREAMDRIGGFVGGLDPHVTSGL